MREKHTRQRDSTTLVYYPHIASPTVVPMFVRYLTLFLAVVVGTILADTWTVTMTPNSNAVGEQTTSFGKTNYVMGLQTGNVVYWSATLNSTHPNATVMADTGNAVVTFKKGIFLNYVENQGEV